MNVSIDVYAQESQKHYTKDLLEKIAQKTIEKSQKINCDDLDVALSVALVDEREIQKVNKQLRDKDAITDVISVGEYSDNRDISKECSGEVFLGEVILCYNFIKQFANRNNLNIDKEFFTVYAHGILHLLGFEHGDEMFVLQDAISEEFCYNK